MLTLETLQTLAVAAFGGLCILSAVLERDQGPVARAAMLLIGAACVVASML